MHRREAQASTALVHTAVETALRETSAINASRHLRPLVTGLFLLCSLYFIDWFGDRDRDRDHDLLSLFPLVLLSMLCTVFAMRSLLLCWLRYMNGPLFLIGLLLSHPLCDDQVRRLIAPCALSGPCGEDDVIRALRRHAIHSIHWLAL